MPLLEDDSHIPGDIPGTVRKAFKFTINSALQILDNPKIHNMFYEDTHFSFMINSEKTTQVLFSKGNPTVWNDDGACWGIFVDNNYLYLALHNGEVVNASSFGKTLYFRSVEPIMANRRRKLYSINFKASTRVVEMFVDSIPVNVMFEASRPGAWSYGSNYITQYFHLKNSNKPLLAGRGEGLPYGEFTLYYDVFEARTLTQEEINTYYQPIADNRVLPELGKMIFVSNKDDPYDYLNSTFSMNEDGSDVVPVFSASYPMGYAKFGPDKHSFAATCQNTGSIQYRLSNGTSVNKVLSGITPMSASINADESKLYFTGNSSNSRAAIYCLNLATEQITDAIPATSYTDLGIVSCHPTNPNIIAYGYMESSATMLIKVKNMSTQTESIVYTTANTSVTTIQGVRSVPLFSLFWSKDGSKLGFTAHTGFGNTKYKAVIMDANGDNVKVLSDGIYTAWSFSPDGTKVLLERAKYLIAYNKTVSQLFIRDLATNKEVNITNMPFTCTYADWAT